MHAPWRMRLTSKAFHDGDEIPMKYTVDGLDISPPLTWSGIPAGTHSLALVVEDPDEPDPAAPATVPWVHWVVSDLPPSLDGLPEDVRMLRHGHIGVNDWQNSAWNGPSPPKGTHRYVFRLFAVDRTLDLDRPSKRELEFAMRGHVIADATLMGTYHRHH
jgi:hypothetical protein